MIGGWWYPIGYLGRAPVHHPAARRDRRADCGAPQQRTSADARAAVAVAAAGVARRECREPRAPLARGRSQRVPAAVRFLSCEPLLGPLPSLPLTGIDSVIVGGESGPTHRPIDPAWMRDIRDQCVAVGVAFFFKQWGGRTPTAGGRLLDGATWDEYPTARPIGVVRRGEPES